MLLFLYSNIDISWQIHKPVTRRFEGFRQTPILTRIIIAFPAIIYYYTAVKVGLYDDKSTHTCIILIVMHHPCMAQNTT